MFKKSPNDDNFDNIPAIDDALISSDDDGYIDSVLISSAYYCNWPSPPSGCGK